MFFFFNGTSILSWRCLHCLKHRVAWEFTCLNAWREWDDGWPVENNNCGKKSICLEFQLFQRIVCRADGNESSQKHAFHATNGITAFNWTSRWRIKNEVSFDKKKIREATKIIGSMELMRDFLKKQTFGHLLVEFVITRLHRDTHYAPRPVQFRAGD